MMKVLLTGGIGSGKSVVAGYFSTRGAFVYDSDSAARRLYAQDARLREKIKEMFGSGVLTPDGVNTRELANIVFADAAALSALEAVVHPAVMEDFLREAEASGKEVAVMESAIAAAKPLFKGFFDKVVVVDAPQRLRLERACVRDRASEASVRKRMDAQNDGMLVKADIVIENDKDFEYLKKQAEKAWNSLK
ncbi:MAG: dephospho-CoA kinase [Bacteroidales bacterium]|nr:dephospho-CoA kinase [Bacteroidales bacterium]